jgi:hypothetical protein
MERIDQFDEFLDDTYPAVSIVGLTFWPSKVLFDCDPVAYRIYGNDYLSEIGEDNGLE